MAAGVLIGGLCGLINGLLVTQLRLPPFVVTLGMLSIARGSAIWLAERTLIAFPVGARPGWVESLALSRLYNPGLREHITRNWAQLRFETLYRDGGDVRGNPLC